MYFYLNIQHEKGFIARLITSVYHTTVYSVRRCHRKLPNLMAKNYVTFIK